MTTPVQSVPFDQPLYGASPADSFLRFWKKYATFSGRASRSEYWWWTLVYFAILIVVFGLSVMGKAFVMNAAGRMVGATPFGLAMAFVGLLFFLATVVPSIALAVRRLHDANFSGALYFLSFVPSVGTLIVLVFAVLPSNPAGARFDRAA